MGFDFLHQTITSSDILRVLIVIALECSLSADNALAIAILIKKLPEAKRTKALWIGLWSSMLLRFGAILFASHFIRYYWVQILGGLYLIYLAIMHFIKKDKVAKDSFQRKVSFWKIVALVELTDLLFALDSILAAFGVIQPSKTFPPPNLWIVYVGGLIGLVIMRFAAKFFTKLIDKYSWIEKAAHALLILIGIKLCLQPVKIWFFN